MIERIQQAHALYCRLTGQRVSLRFDRERLWYELFQAGFNEADLQRVIRYLQREIREGRRNVGALKLSISCNWTASKRISISVACGFTLPRPLPSRPKLPPSRLRLPRQAVKRKTKPPASVPYKSWPAFGRSRVGSFPRSIPERPAQNIGSPSLDTNSHRPPRTSLQPYPRATTLFP